MKCLKCKTEKNLRLSDDLCWLCAEEFAAMVDHYTKLWLSGEILVGTEMLQAWMDRSGEAF